MTNRHTHDERDAWHSSDANQAARLTHGIGVIDGFGISVAAETIEIESGTGWFGEIVEFDSEVLDIDADGELPRKVVIYGDGEADLHAAHGDPAEPRPRGKTGRQTYHPSPPDLSGTDAMVLFEIWVPPTGGWDVTDRRDESRINVHEIVAHSATVDSFEGTTASVADAPEEQTDVARKAEADALSEDIGSVDGALQTHTEDGNNPHETTLEQARSEGEQLDGPVDAGGNDINNVGKVTSNETETESLTVESANIGETITSVRSGESTSIPNGTNTQIPLSVDIHDELGIADLDNDELVIKEPGKYLINGFATWENGPNWSTGDVANVRPEINDNTVYFHFQYKLSDDSQFAQFYPVIDDLDEGDVILFEARQDSGDSQQLDGSDHERMQINVIKLG